MSKVYKSEVSAAIHETAEGLYEHEVIDEKSMHEFNESCLAPPSLNEKGIINQPGTDKDGSQPFAANIGLFQSSD